MKKILIPTDFSAEAQNAAEVGRTLAKKFNAELVFLNSIEITSSETINVSGGPSNIDSFTDSMLVHESIKRANVEMERLVDVSKYRGIAVSKIIRLGSPFMHINELVEEEGVDFIVMGTKGASGLNEVLIGSNTEKVVRRAKCPVLSVKGEVDEAVFKSIVYATEMSENEDGVVATLKEFQAAYDAKINIVWINTPNNFQADRTTKALLHKFATKHQLSNYEVFVFNDIIEEDGIRHFADEINGGLIVMGTSSHTGLSRIIRGSIAEDMVNHAKRPVLTVSMKY